MLPHLPRKVGQNPRHQVAFSCNAVSQSPKGESDDDRDRDTGRDNTVLNGPGTGSAIHEAQGKFKHWIAPS